jgi:hypothetical protein
MSSTNHHHRGTEAQRHRDTETQRHRDTETTLVEEFLADSVSLGVHVLQWDITDVSSIGPGHKQFASTTAHGASQDSGCPVLALRLTTGGPPFVPPLFGGTRWELGQSTCLRPCAPASAADDSGCCSSCCGQAARAWVEIARQATSAEQMPPHWASADSAADAASQALAEIERRPRSAARTPGHSALADSAADAGSTVSLTQRMAAVWDAKLPQMAAGSPALPQIPAERDAGSKVHSAARLLHWRREHLTAVAAGVVPGG